MTHSQSAAIGKVHAGFQRAAHIFGLKRPGEASHSWGVALVEFLFGPRFFLSQHLLWTTWSCPKF